MHTPAMQHLHWHHRAEIVAAVLRRQQVQTATLLEAADSYFAYAPVLKALQQSSEAALPFSQLLKYNATAKVLLGLAY